MDLRLSLQRFRLQLIRPRYRIRFPRSLRVLSKAPDFCATDTSANCRTSALSEHHSTTMIEGRVRPR